MYYRHIILTHLEVGARVPFLSVYEAGELNREIQQKCICKLHVYCTAKKAKNLINSPTLALQKYFTK